MFLRISIFVAAVWAVCGAASFACLNSYGTDSHGHTATLHEHHLELANRLRSSTIDRVRWLAEERELAADLANADFRHRSDYAVALIYLQRYDEAIRILKQVEEEVPGESVVAANLGTAYELNGELEKALVWITKGLERDSTAHGGSEWLHAQILAARIELAKDPDWLTTHTVLGLDFGNDAAPTRPATDPVDITGKTHDLADVATALEYQLSERLKFVPPDDRIAASLLFDLGNAVALTDVIERAVPVYELAREYGVEKPTLLERRINHFRIMIAANPVSGTQMGGITWISLLGLGALLLGVLAAIFLALYLAYRFLMPAR